MDRIEPKVPNPPYHHKKLPMTDDEIRNHFRLAKDQIEDIKILSELNAVSKLVICFILGIDPPDGLSTKDYYA